MNFKKSIVAYLRTNIASWTTELNESGDIHIIVDDDKPLKVYYSSLLTILWLMLAEIPHRAEKVHMILTNQSKTSQFCYTFDPNSSYT